MSDDGAFRRSVEFGRILLAIHLNTAGGRRERKKLLMLSRRNKMLSVGILAIDKPLQVAILGDVLALMPKLKKPAKVEGRLPFERALRAMAGWE